MAGFSLQRDEENDERPEGIWTPWGPDVTKEEKEEGKVREGFKIRPLRPKNMDHFHKIATKKKWRNNQQVEDEDRDQYLELLYDFLIEDWQGIYEDEKQKIPAACTLENKLIMVERSLDRVNFIVTQASLYANDDDARKEAQRKSFRRPSEVSA